jgi:hypothetical protein
VSSVEPPAFKSLLKNILFWRLLQVGAPALGYCLGSLLYSAFVK